ncbi:TadE/TadG family type IV pilus assembly protein [Hyphobacterium sp. HN65]|uniref:TadE/TadG family type IV pilus assembly protein n=1 Tax=Hyphobacterium lacteum TaxID=3116575 RepID=A0ABU7LNM3_9PROT|nr:TadE/TadG family type IV pilus assembly protein [Hyphobacterium sp. HN65]MEE2525518.1 TadE/TadG family type IV pilus assembly protein [Hyphobacterium sp. HN65]
MIRALRNILCRLGRDKSGVSAVEFALIAPVMVVLYLGMVEISLALSADRKVTNAASALADLIAQDDVITDAEMTDILNAGVAIIQPFSADQFSVRISSVSMSLLGEVEVDWSDGRGMLPRAPGSQPTVPAGVLAPGRSVVWVEVAYAYQAPFREITGDFDINEEFFLRPRQSLSVSRQ